MKRGSLGMLLAAALLALVPALAQAACTGSVMPGGGQRFSLRGAEAHDRRTGLVWQRCSVGAQWNGKGCNGPRADISLGEAQEAADKAGGGWRVPTLRELASLIDRDCGRPAIDTRVFPDVTDSPDEGAEELWTSTPGNLADMVYFIDFAEGYGDVRTPGFSRSARLVRSAP